MIFDNTAACRFHRAGVICEMSYCPKSCGWHPDEQARRKRLLRTNCLTQNRNGLYRLKVPRCNG